MMTLDDSELARKQLRAITYLLKIGEIRAKAVYDLVHVLRGLVGYPRITLGTMYFSRTEMELECVGWIDGIEEDIRKKRLDGDSIKKDINGLYRVVLAKFKEIEENHDRDMEHLVEELLWSTTTT